MSETISATIALHERLARLRSTGSRIADLATGELDIRPPERALLSAREAVDLPASNRYGDLRGMPQLREAVARRLSTRHGVDIASDDVVITHGGKQALGCLLAALVGPGDEVLLPTPRWVTYASAVRAVGGREVYLPWSPGHLVDLESLESARTAATRALVLCSPDNPSGRILSEEDVHAIADWSAATGVWVVLDDVYGELGPNEAPSLLAAASSVGGRAVLLGSVSKAYGMAGWRVGWLAAPPAVGVAAAAALSHATYSVGLVAQHAALGALGDAAWLRQARIDIASRRRLVVDGLHAAGLAIHEPAGGLYCLATLPSRTDDVEYCEAVLATTGVAIAPGRPFGADGHVRVCFGADRPTIAWAMERLADRIAEAS